MTLSAPGLAVERAEGLPSPSGRSPAPQPGPSGLGRAGGEGRQTGQPTGETRGTDGSEHETGLGWPIAHLLPFTAGQLIAVLGASDEVIRDLRAARVECIYVPVRRCGEERLLGSLMDASVDHVVAVDCDVPVARHVVGEAARVLRPEGWLALEVGAGAARGPCFDRLPRRGGPGSLRLWWDLLSRNGLRPMGGYDLHDRQGQGQYLVPIGCRPARDYFRRRLAMSDRGGPRIWLRRRHRSFKSMVILGARISEVLPFSPVC